MHHALALLSVLALSALFAVLNTQSGPAAILSFSQFLSGATASLLLLALPLAAVFASSRDRQSLTQQLRAPTALGPHPIFRFAALFVLLLLAVYATETLAQAPQDQALVQQLAPFSFFERLALIPVICLLSPMIEELLYRGFLLAVGPAGLALPLSALVFALAHGVNAHLPALLMLGLFLGLVTLRTRSLRAAILLHAAFNLLNLLLL